MDFKIGLGLGHWDEHALGLFLKLKRYLAVLRTSQESSFDNLKKNKILKIFTRKTQVLHTNRIIRILLVATFVGCSQQLLL